LGSVQEQPCSQDLSPARASAYRALCKCAKVHVGTTPPGVGIKMFREVAEHFGRDLVMRTNLNKNKFMVLLAFLQGKGTSNFVLVEPTD